MDSNTMEDNGNYITRNSASHRKSKSPLSQVTSHSKRPSLYLGRTPPLHGYRAWLAPLAEGTTQIQQGWVAQRQGLDAVMFPLFVFPQWMEVVIFTVILSPTGWPLLGWWGLHALWKSYTYLHFSIRGGWSLLTLNPVGGRTDKPAHPPSRVHTAAERAAA